MPTASTRAARRLRGVGPAATRPNDLARTLGFGCASVRSVLTVHGMVASTVARWGDDERRRRWLPGLASGAAVGALALSEPDAGSDAAAIATTARRAGDRHVLEGRKRWVTYGQRADVFLVFAREEGRPCAFLLPRATPGLEVRPVRGLLGTRATWMAKYFASVAAFVERGQDQNVRHAESAPDPRR